MPRHGRPVGLFGIAAVCVALGAGTGAATQVHRPFAALDTSGGAVGGPFVASGAAAFSIAPAAAGDGPLAIAPLAVDQPATGVSEAPPGASGRPFANFGRTLLSDTVTIGTAPLHWDRHAWLEALTGVAGIAALTAFDERIAHGVQTHRNATTDRVARAVEPFGADRAFETIGAFYLAGLVLHDDRAKDVAADSIVSSIVAAGLISPVIKAIVGRARPSQTGGEEDIAHPFGSNQSFPSGHTTEAFAVASVIAAHYDSTWVNVASYGLAAMVGLARIDHNAHFASDVLAGALLGTVVGREVVRLDAARWGVASTGHYFEVGPLVTARGAGVDLRLTF